MTLKDRGDEMLELGQIDYINASPVYYGLDNGLLPPWIRLHPHPPSVLNRMIMDGEIHMGPVSAAFYGMNHGSLMVIPDLSISSHGDVMSVILVSDYPMDQLDRKIIMLSGESATSTCLVKLIMAENHIRPHFVTGKLRTLEDVPEKAAAAMVIGDAAMTEDWGNRFRYRFDLGREWHRMTALPFVYALWVVREGYARKYPERVSEALSLLYQSRSMGYAHIDRVIQAGSRKLRLDTDYVRRYFKGLLCDLDDGKQKGIHRFFHGLYRNGIFKEDVRLRYFEPCQRRIMGSLQETRTLVPKPE